MADSFKLEIIKCFIDGQAFLAVGYDLAWLNTSPSLVIKLDRRHTGRLRKIDCLLSGGKEGGGPGAESYDRAKAWSSINHSMISPLLDTYFQI